MSTDATPTSTFTSWADEEEPARKNERKQLELQKKNQASIMSWKPSEQKILPGERSTVSNAADRPDQAKAERRLRDFVTQMSQANLRRTLLVEVVGAKTSLKWVR